ncbi:hypothetical protein RRG08_014082 [Elysia crispata]|uniref:Uncharacterized protein n=1 Tax=Elysia crispata TaxID=231223 RepID=A0AAE1AU86_9GAST|nr:hypothetical protein RRG08_014082 [Elysia crispata]
MKILLRKHQLLHHGLDKPKKLTERNAKENIPTIILSIAAPVALGLVSPAIRTLRSVIVILSSVQSEPCASNIGRLRGYLAVFFISCAVKAIVKLVDPHASSNHGHRLLTLSPQESSSDSSGLSHRHSLLACRPSSLVLASILQQASIRPLAPGDLWI